AYSRILGGPLGETDQLTLTNGESQRPGALFSVQGTQTKKVASALEGDVAALGKIDPVAAGDLLARQGVQKLKIAPEKRFPGFALAIATKDRKDDVRLSGALQKLAEEDPGLHVVHDQLTHEILLLGQGDPHLRAVIDRLKKRFGVEVATHRPSTPYQETIRKSA